MFAYLLYLLTVLTLLFCAVLNYICLGVVVLQCAFLLLVVLRSARVHCMHLTVLTCKLQLHIFCYSLISLFCCAFTFFCQTPNLKL